MRQVLFAVAATLSCLSMLGCPYVPTNASHMQEAATDFNTNVRFGRNELAVEQVLPESREDFLRHRKAWGKELNVADYELVSAKMVDDDNADVCIKYNWYNVSDNDLHVTTVKQKWKKRHGDWKLASEARTEGDEGIFGEEGPTRVAGDPLAPRSVQFPTVRFGE
jgi:hypothetical protein